MILGSLVALFLAIDMAVSAARLGTSIRWRGSRLFPTPSSEADHHQEASHPPMQKESRHHRRIGKVSEIRNTKFPTPTVRAAAVGSAVIGCAAGEAQTRERPEAMRRE